LTRVINLEAGKYVSFSDRLGNDGHTSTTNKRFIMQKLSNFFSRTLVLAVIAATIVSCTPAAKKARYAKRGEEYFKAGEYDKAKIEYLNVLRVDQGDANAYGRIGAMWLDEGAPLRAGAFLHKAIELAPNNIDNHLKLARVYLAVGRVADARKEAMTVLEKAPDSGQALFILVDAAQKPEDVAALEQELQKFPHHDTADYYLASAGIAGKKGDIAAAEAALQRAAAADPNLPVVHSALGTLYLVKKDVEKAGAELEKAATLSPARSTEKLKFAQFKVQTGASAEAKAFLEKVTKETPDLLPAWSILAKIANSEKKYDEARQLLQNVLSRDPENLDARLVQAETWLSMQETKKAVDSLENLNRTYPNSPVIKYTLARSYLANKSPKQALDELDETVRLNPGYADAVLLRSELQLRDGNARAAVEPLQAVLKSRPDLPAGPVLLAEAYRMLGRFDEAAALIREQIKKSPKVAASHYLLGAILKQQNKQLEARQAFEKAAELEPENPSSLEQLVNLDIDGKAYEAGHQRVNHWQQKQSNSAAAYYLQGKLYSAEGKFDVAQTALLKAIDLDPNFSRAYDLLVPIFSRANKLPEALNEMNAVLAKKPNDVRALLLTASIYDAMKDYNKARDSYEKVVTVDPNAVVALNNLAFIYAEKLNDLNRAAELAQKARSIAPTNPSVLDTLGWITYKQGGYQQAVDLLGQSAAKSPDNPEIQFHLGMAEYMMGQTEAALSALEKAVGSATEFEGKEEARRRLALLGKEGASGQSLSVAELEASLKQQPNDPVGLMRLAEAYEKEGAVAKAVDAYERAFKANPKLPTAAMKLAQLNAGPLKNPDKALQYAKKARELAPADPNAAATVGSIAFQLGNCTWSYSLLQEASRQLPNDPAVLHDLAWAAYSLGKVPEARQAMQSVQSSGPTSPQSADARTFLAMTALTTGEDDVSASEAEINSALAADPNYVPALIARAAIEVKRGDMAGAEATYRKVLQRFPDFAPAQRDLALVLVNDPAKRDAAYELATKARRTISDDPLMSIVLARVSYERKDFSRAIQQFQESAREKPLDARSLYYLGMAHAQAKHKAEAKETLNRALQAGLGDAEANEAKRVLADIGGS
jgi:tetratricopeptide (TPR) repeat protein